MKAEQIFDLSNFKSKADTRNSRTVTIFKNICNCVSNDVDTLQHLSIYDITKILSLQKITTSKVKSINKAALQIVLNYFQNEGVLSESQVATLSLVDWDEVVLSAIETYYFKDLDEVIDYLEKVAKCASVDLNDWSMYASIFVVAYYLSMVSISREDIVGIKKEDCDDTKNSITLSPAQTIVLPEQHYYWIKLYKEATEISGLHGDTMTLQESPWLFRNSVSTRFTDNAISSLIKELNIFVRQRMNIVKVFDVTDIHNIGLFNKISDEMSKYGHSFLQATFYFNKVERSNIRVLYNLWAKKYNKKRETV